MGLGGESGQEILWFYLSGTHQEEVVEMEHLQEG